MKREVIDSYNRGMESLFQTKSEIAEHPQFSLLFSAAEMRDMEIFDDAKRTIPLGVEILEEQLNKTQVKLKDGEMELVVFGLYVPPEKEASLQRWISEFEEKYSIKLVIQRHPSYKGIRNLFDEYFDKGEILKSRHIADIEKISKKFFGFPPNETNIESCLQRIEGLPDLSDMPFVAMDSSETCDPEDAICVEKLAEDRYRITTAISDVSWLIDPRGQQKDFAVSLGATIYGSDHIISTLGKLAESGYTHFSTEEKRPAWIIQYEVESNKRVRFLKEPFLANVRLNRKIPLENIVSEASDPALRDLMSASFLLKSQRVRHNVQIGSLKNMQINPGLIVSETMIRAKEGFALFLSKHKPRKAVFKIQQNLSLNKARELVRNLRSLGIEVRSDIFRNPILLADFLTELQNNSFASRIKNGCDASGLDAVTRQILDALLKRSHYDNHNRGHADLRLQSYCDIKGRLAAGIVNQLQARSILLGGYRPYSVAEIVKMTNKINRQMRNYGIKVYTLRFLEMLKDKLSHEGEVFNSWVVKRKDDEHVFIDIPGFKKWGIMKLTDNKTGETLHAKLRGYSLAEQRFIFDVTL